jgi:hypothetical protein
MTIRVLCAICSLVTLFIPVVAEAQQSGPDYRNAKLPIERRVADLLRRMPLEEKVDQITGGHHYSILDKTGRFPEERASRMTHFFSWIL